MLHDTASGPRLGVGKVADHIHALNPEAFQYNIIRHNRCDVCDTGKHILNNQYYVETAMGNIVTTNTISTTQNTIKLLATVSTKDIKTIVGFTIIASNGAELTSGNEPLHDYN